MPDAFIWYHASEKLEPELLHWLDEVEDQAGVRGKLLVRKDKNTSTFMETYADVSSATITRIEKMATHEPLFDNIERRCESFIEIG